MGVWEQEPMINKHGRLDLNGHGGERSSETDSLPCVGRQELIYDDERIPCTLERHVILKKKLSLIPDTHHHYILYDDKILDDSKS